VRLIFVDRSALLPHAAISPDECNLKREAPARPVIISSLDIVSRPSFVVGATKFLEML
jgi:hypothetical protein